MDGLDRMPWVLRRVSEEDRRRWIEAVFIVRTTDSPLAVMRAMATMRELLQIYERAAVEEARGRGASWADIGEALGRSRQSVHRQFGGR